MSALEKTVITEKLIIHQVVINNVQDGKQKKVEIILYSQAVQPNLSNPMLNESHEFCWIKEVVGLSSHLCNPTFHNI